MVCRALILLLLAFDERQEGTKGIGTQMQGVMTCTKRDSKYDWIVMKKAQGFHVVLMCHDRRLCRVNSTAHSQGAPSGRICLQLFKAGNPELKVPYDT